MARTSFAMLCAVLSLIVFASGAMAAGPPLPAKRPPELRIEVLLRSARYAEARDLAERHLQDMRARFGANDPQIATALHHLSAVLRDLARYAEAEDNARAALAIREAAFGGDNAQVAESLNLLGMILLARGHYKDAQPLLERALVINERTRGLAHVATADSLSRLAEMKRLLVDSAGAEPLARRALVIREKALGDHPDTAESSQLLGAILFDLGRQAEAEPLLRRARAIREALLDPGHPDLAYSLQWEGFLLQRQGRLADAEPLFQRAVEICTGAFGQDHPCMGTALMILADLRDAQKQPEEAEALYRRALAIYEPIVGGDHKYVGNTLVRLGRLYRNTSRPKEAEVALSRALAIFESVYGPEHSETLVAIHAKAEAIQDQGRYPEATQQYERALALTRKLYGETHTQVVFALAPLIGVYYVRGLYTDAEQKTNQAIDIIRTFPPDQQDQLLSTYYLSLGYIYQGQRRFADALPKFQEALRLRVKIKGENDAETARIVDVLALANRIEARFQDSEALYRRELTILETVRGASHPDLAKALTQFASLLIERARYGEAEALLQRALAIFGGGDTLDVADVLGRMGTLFQRVGRYQDAEVAMRRALAIGEKLQPNKWFITSDLNNLAVLLQARAKYGEAEALFKRVLAMGQESVEADHPIIGVWFNNLGTLYLDQGRPKEAAEMNRRAIEILEKRSGDGTVALSNRASLYSYEGRYAEAEALFRRSLAESEARFGSGHPDVALSLSNLAGCLQDQGRYDEAGPLLLRVIAIRETVLGQTHPDLATTYGQLAALRAAQGHFAEAEQRYRSAQATNEAALGLEHPDTAMDYNNLGSFYTQTGRPADGESLLKRARAVWEKALGPEHPRTLVALGNLASAVASQKRYEEAEQLYRQNVALRERVFGPDHPDTALALNNLATFYLDQLRYADAVPLLERALSVWTERLGRDHPLTVVAISNLGIGLTGLGRYAEAGPLLEEALALRQRILGEAHPDVAQALNNLASLKEKAGADIRTAYDLAHRATAILLGRARRESGRLDEAEVGGNRAELGYNANVFLRYAQLAFKLSEAVPAQGGALLDEAFQMAEWAHQSSVAAALSQMTTRLSKDEGELPLLVRRRQDLVWRYRALDRQLITAAANPAEVRSPDIEVGWRKELAGLDEAIRSMDLTLKERFPDYAALANPEPLTVAEVQSQLRSDEALFLIIVGKENSVAWVITPKDAQWRALPVSEARLQEDVEALRCGLDRTLWDDPGHDQTARARRDRCKALLGREPESPSRPPFDLGRAYRLYQALFAPFESAIAGRHLFVVPTGPLTTLPLHVLVTQAPDENSGASEIQQLAGAAWLGKRQAITVLPSVPSLKVARSGAKPSGASKPFVAFANPLLLGPSGADRSAWQRQSCPPGAVPTATEENRQAAVAARAPAGLHNGGQVELSLLRTQYPLPETADEACAVARELGAAETDVFLGSKASETSLKALSENGGLKAYHVVHFATHGLIAGETELLSRSKTEPSLLLTPPDFASDEDDGLLTASEVARLSLDADAVVLSACNTASGSGAPEAEALSGLARAFFYAGARALLVTHWYVNSAAAVELVTGTFAERKADPTINLAEAMRRAMVHGIDSGGGRAHPAYWAPFVVVAGD